MYSTLFGEVEGSGAKVGLADSAGDLYVGGSGNVPTTPGVVDPIACQNCTGFLSKIDPTGQSLVYSTYVEGVYVRAIAVDSSGDIYIGGLVPPAGVQGGGSEPILPIPSSSTPFQASPKGLNIGILKLNSTATTNLAATYLGGSSFEQIGGLAVDADNNVCIVGTTTSNDFPVSKNALQSSLGSSGQIRLFC